MATPNQNDRERPIEPQNQPSSAWRTVGRIAAIAAGVIVVLIVLALIFIDPLLNWYAKDKITAAVNKQGGQELRIQSLHYSLFSNALFLEGISYKRTDTTRDGIDQVKIDTEYVSVGGVGWFGLLFSNGLQFDELLLQSPRVNIVHGPGGTVAKDTVNVDTTSGEKSVADLLAEALPDNVLPLRVRQVLIDKGTFVQQRRGKRIADDSVGQLSLTVNRFAVDSTGSRSKVALYSSADLRASKLAWKLSESDYSIKADSAVFYSGDSVESQLALFSLSFQPVISDKQFYAKRKFRTVRFRVTSQRLTIQGDNLREILDGNAIQARSIKLRKPTIDILLNKRLPVDPASPPAKMPHELIAEVEVPFRIDTLAIDGGTVLYSEMFPYDDKPAVLRFTNVKVNVTDLAHTPQQSGGRPVTLLATGNMAGAGPLQVDMKLSLHSKSLDFAYAGKLGAMKAEALNEFLTVSDRIRITSGDVKSAEFAIKVLGGKASGTLRAVYSNLKVQTLDEESGRAGGLIESFKTFMANAFKIRSDNTPEDMKVGKVAYVKKPDDAFMDVVWLSLRGGLGEIVGF